MAYRLHKHHVIERTTPDRLVDVVREMVGIHAQVASSAELQLAARIDGLRPADVQDALATRRTPREGLVDARHAPPARARRTWPGSSVASGTRERWREAPWQKAYEVTFEQVEAMIAAVGDTLSDEPMLAGRPRRRGRRPPGRSRRSPRSCAPAGARSSGPVAQRGLLCFGPPAGRNVTFVRPSAWLGRPIAPR